MSAFLDTILPSAPVAPTLSSPRTLLLYTDAKIGKTTTAALVSALYNGVLLDCEDGSEAMGGYRVNVIRKADAMGSTKVDLFLQICEELRMANPARADFVFIDKLDALRNWSERWATHDYKHSVIGSSFKEESILMLPKFAGYAYLAEKFFKLFTAAASAAPHVIYFAGLRAKYSEEARFAKTDVVTAADDINLTGALREQVVSFVDATGFLFRGKDGANYVSFATKDQGAYAGCRISRIEGKTIKLSWKDASGALQVDWKAIFPDAKERAGANETVKQTP